MSLYQETIALLNGEPGKNLQSLGLSPFYRLTLKKILISIYLDAPGLTCGMGSILD